MSVRSHYDEDLNQLYQEVAALGAAVTGAVEVAVQAFEKHDLDTAQQVIRNDSEIDKQHEALEQRVMQIIALQQPVAGDLRRLLAALEVASELERIGDYAKRIGKATLRQPALPTAAPQNYIAQIGELAVSMLRDGMSSFIARDTSVLTNIQARDDEIDRLEDMVRADMLLLIQKEPAAAEWAMDQTLVAHTLERVGDRVTNVAEQLVFALRGERVDLNP